MLSSPKNSAAQAICRGDGVMHHTAGTFRLCDEDVMVGLIEGVACTAKTGRCSRPRVKSGTLVVADVKRGYMGNAEYCC